MSVADPVARHALRFLGTERRLRWSVFAAGCLGCGALVCADPACGSAAEPQLDSLRAYGYLVKLCTFGPRPSGSPGMTAQRAWIAEQFEKAGGQVRLQEFDARHPQTGTPVRMANVIVAWHPEAKERVLLCCHYDTRPFPDRDPRNPKGRFVGANDGASGVALLLEMAHSMKSLPVTYGVDFVLFDGEELVFDPNDPYFLGSEHFAKQYRDSPPAHRYVWGVLVDMIGDADLQIAPERFSAEKYAPELVRSIWGTAKRLRVDEFLPEARYEVRDDHVPLNEIAGIPTCDLIDFDYPYWHTQEDVPRRCSGASLRKVARVLLTWLGEVPPRTRAKTEK